MSSLPVRLSVSLSHLFILFFGIIKGLKDLSPKKRQKLRTKMELWKIYEESDWGLVIFSCGSHPLMRFTCHLPIWKLLDWGLGRGEFFAKLTQFRLPLGWAWRISRQPLCLFCAFLEHETTSKRTPTWTFHMRWISGTDSMAGYVDTK